MQSVLQQKKLGDQINMAMKRVSDQLTPGMFANYEESIEHFVKWSRFFIYESN